MGLYLLVVSREERSISCGDDILWITFPQSLLPARKVQEVETRVLGSLELSGESYACSAF